jgi:serine/threonine protein kinase
MHRDIKPQNILLQGSTPKIADFGFACRSQLPRREAYTIGSPLYMSPEALTRREYSVKNDMWALGVTMFEVLEGRPPWQANSEKDLRDAIKA